MERIDGTDHLVTGLALTPPDGRVRAFHLRYDVIIEQLVTHTAIATIRTEWKKGTTARSPQALGAFDWTTRSLDVDADGGSWLRGFTVTVGLGFEHIGAGADHLLFLLMLLVPAPLVVGGGRWRPRDDARRSVVRVVHVVTAFAVGHSITLALATLGLINVPSRLVESLIALSIVVSAAHVVRPLVPGGEAVIAAGFGLVHGLAFATLARRPRAYMAARSRLRCSASTSASRLTQLLVVALMMPSLYVLSRTAAYGWFGSRWRCSASPCPAPGSSSVRRRSEATRSHRSRRRWSGTRSPCRPRSRWRPSSLVTFRSCGPRVSV